jgi:hypothetical protein
VTDEEFAEGLAVEVGAAIFAEIKRHPLPSSSPWSEPVNAFWGLGATEIGAIAVEMTLAQLAAESRGRRRARRLRSMARRLRRRFPRVFPAKVVMFR